MSECLAKKYWPGEWQTHQYTWMIWPKRVAIWENFDEAQSTYADIANCISEHEPVKMLIASEHVKKAKRLLSSSIQLLIAEMDDSWARDVLPIFLLEDQQLVASNWRFNAWGEKYTPYSLDAELSRWLCRTMAYRSENMPLVLEGGSVHSNGMGCLMTTEECLLDPNRNPNYTQAEIEQILCDAFSATQIVWLPHGLDGDIDTDGHVDNVACFVDPNLVLLQSCHDRQDNNHQRFVRNLDVVNSMGFDTCLIEQPPRIEHRSQRLAASYINFYSLNDAIVMPRFGCRKQDDAAYHTIQSLYCDRMVYQIDARPLIIGGGGIHCITKQVPRGESM